MNINVYEDWNLNPNRLIIQSMSYFVEHSVELRRLQPAGYLPISSLFLTSGGFDPLHPGHISVFEDAHEAVSKQTGGRFYRHEKLVVLVNGDNFLKKKKGNSFMDLQTRCQIVSQIKKVNVVIPFIPSDPEDMTVCEAILKIKPDYFLKGGDRTGIENIPEWSSCKEVGCEIVTNVGQPKYWSSSDFLAEWTSRWIEDNLPE